MRVRPRYLVGGIGIRLFGVIANTQYRVMRPNSQKAHIMSIELPTARGVENGANYDRIGRTSDRQSESREP